jgi:hypothetical protein
VNQFKRARLAAAFAAIAALAGAGAAQAEACASFGSYDGTDWDACAVSDSSPQQYGINPRGFDPASGSAWSVLASVDQFGTITNNSGAFLFDNLSLVAGGTRAIDWPNGSWSTPNQSNLTFFTREVVVAPVQEPKTYALMLAGLTAVGFIARRRKTL